MFVSLLLVIMQSGDQSIYSKLDLIICIGKETIHQLFGTRVAVLAGDFMFAQSSWFLANLENIEVIKLISQVLQNPSRL